MKEGDPFEFMVIKKIPLVNPLIFNINPWAINVRLCKARLNAWPYKSTQADTQTVNSSLVRIWNSLFPSRIRVHSLLLRNGKSDFLGVTDLSYQALKHIQTQGSDQNLESLGMPTACSVSTFSIQQSTGYKANTSTTSSKEAPCVSTTGVKPHRPLYKKGTVQTWITLCFPHRPASTLIEQLDLDNFGTHSACG